jgi:hypothetical protein
MAAYVGGNEQGRKGIPSMTHVYDGQYERNEKTRDGMMRRRDQRKRHIAHTGTVAESSVQGYNSRIANRWDALLGNVGGINGEPTGNSYLTVKSRI